MRGYGFLGYEGGPDVFCHYTAIQSSGYKSLKAGDPVRFSIEQGKKGAQAARVTRLAGVEDEPVDELRQQG